MPAGKSFGPYTTGVEVAAGVAVGISVGVDEGGKVAVGGKDVSVAAGMMVGVAVSGKGEGVLVLQAAKIKVNNRLLRRRLSIVLQLSYLNNFLMIPHINCKPMGIFQFPGVLPAPLLT
jgi:hypothetical protein